MTTPLHASSVGIAMLVSGGIRMRSISAVGSAGEELTKSTGVVCR